jgi:hypothetical protein
VDHSLAARWIDGIHYMWYVMSNRTVYSTAKKGPLCVIDLMACMNSSSQVCVTYTCSLVA